MKRIGDFLIRHKTPVTVEDDVTYKQVTIRTGYKGVVLRGTKVGVAIGTKNQWRVKANQFILSRIDARNGAFGIIPNELDGAIVTNDFLAFDINNEEVEREFFNVFLQSPTFLNACVKASRGNTNRKRVNEDFFLDYQVNLPPLRKQRNLIVKIIGARSNISTAQQEIARQRALLSKLREAILQEAIEGKLTAGWRAAIAETEPAAKLLERIQVEKNRLLKEKSIRRERPLAEIDPDKVPFEVPEGWAWCRFGSLIETYEAGKSLKCEDRTTTGDEWGIIKTSAITSTRFLEQENKFLTASEPQNISAKIEVRDLLFCRASGSKGLAGSAAIVHCIDLNLLLSDKTIRVRLLCGVLPEYIELHNRSRQSRDYYEGLRSGKSTTMKNVTRPQLLGKPIPLPSLAEQAAIVKRVQALTKICDRLEEKIENCSVNAADLLQAITNEAFTITN